MNTLAKLTVALIDRVLPLLQETPTDRPRHIYPRCTGLWGVAPDDPKAAVCSECRARYSETDPNYGACYTENKAAHLLRAIEMGAVGLPRERSAFGLLDSEQAIRLTRQRRKLEVVREAS